MAGWVMGGSLLFRDIDSGLSDEFKDSSNHCDGNRTILSSTQRNPKTKCDSHLGSPVDQAMKESFQTLGLSPEGRWRPSAKAARMVGHPAGGMWQAEPWRTRTGFQRPHR